MTDEQVRNEAMTIFLAGHETTALTLVWAWYLLSQHPEKESQLHAEVDGLPDRPVTATDFGQLAYTGAVVSETLRLYPPLASLGREALADCLIGRYPVRKGTTLIFAPWVVHRDQRFFSHPDVFEPERWLDGRSNTIPRFAYFPFGGGPRQCIGNSFALMETTLVLAAIARRFQLRLPAGERVVPSMTLTLRPRDALKMKVERRQARTAN